MRSPFPGMDRYLEQFWGHIHHAMITRSRAAIQTQLPGDLAARVDERDFVVPTERLSRSIGPAVRVVERGGRREPVLRTRHGIAIADLLVIHLEQHEPVRQVYIKILDLKSGRRVVTAIEIISPCNKLPGPGRDLYIQKRAELRQAGVNPVETHR